MTNDLEVSKPLGDTTSVPAVAGIDKALTAEIESKALEWRPLLPPTMTIDRFKTVLNMALAMNQKLIAANRPSLWRAVMMAAKDGLLPDGNEAALILNDDGSVAYWPMVHGLERLVREAYPVASITTRAVYTADVWHVRYGDEESIEHIPAQTDRGKLHGSYAIIRLVDGSVFREALFHGDLEDLRRSSPSYGKTSYGASKTAVNRWPAEWARAKALKRAANKIARSAARPQLISSSEDDYEQGEAISQLLPPGGATETAESTKPISGPSAPPRVLPPPHRPPVAQGNSDPQSELVFPDGSRKGPAKGVLTAWIDAWNAEFDATENVDDSLERFVAAYRSACALYRAGDAAKKVAELAGWIQERADVIKAAAAERYAEGGQ